MENKLFELAAARRSVRKYTEKPVDPAVLHEILKTALTAPNSFGHNPVEFVVVQDPDTIEQLAACKTYGGKQILGAAAVIVVMVQQERGELWIEDGSCASTYILLAAEQYGLGTCWVHIRGRNGTHKSSDEEIRDLLSIPDNYAVLNLIALGEKAEEKAPYNESQLDYGKIHYDRF